MTSDLISSIAISDSLGDLTKENYLSRLSKLMSVLNSPIGEILTHPTEFIPKIKEHWHSIKTQKGFFTVLLSLYKYNPDYKKDHADDYAIWSKMLIEVSNKIEDGYNTNEPSQKQLDGFVDWDTFKKKMIDLPVGSENRLLIAMYGGGGIYPMRADYNRVAIFHKKVPAKHEPNYLLIRSKNDMSLVIGEFKTAKTYGSIKIDPLPKVLTDEINSSLSANPREWLFTDRYGKPYSANAFTKLVNRRFKAIFLKPLTITLLRHSAINSLDRNTMTNADMMVVAHQMGHDLRQALNYKLVVKGDDGKNKVLGDK